jgi:hypothetical protein
MYCAYFSAITSALLQRLQRGRLEFPNTTGADALATRLARRLLWRQCRFLGGLRRCSERSVRNQAISDIVLARHGEVVMAVYGGGVRDETVDVNTKGANPNNGVAKAAPPSPGLLTTPPQCAPPHHTGRISLLTVAEDHSHAYILLGGTMTEASWTGDLGCRRRNET